MIDEKKLIEDLKGTSLLNDILIKIVESQPKIGEWIPCSERLPEEKINPVTKDFYEYQVTFQSDEVTDIRHYKFGRGHWWNGPGIMDQYVIAWYPRPESYQSKGGKERDENATD